MLRYLDDLPKALVATDAEARGFIERERLFGSGIGYIDVHLLAAGRLTPAAGFGRSIVGWRMPQQRSGSPHLSLPVSSRPATPRQLW